MESFWRRLRYYGLGFGLGLILTFGIFNTRGCSWMPSNRVKEAMNARIWVMNKAVQQDFFQKNKLTKDQFYNAIQEADITFTKSIRSGKHKVYDLTFNTSSKKDVHCLARMTDESFVVEFIPFVSSVKALKKQKKNNSEAPIIYTPNNKNLVYSDTRPALQTHLKALGLANDSQLQKSLFKGAFHASKSRLNEEPRPLHVFSFRSKNSPEVQLFATCIWYKDKIKIVDLKEDALDF
jgi:hypothetical protein